MAGAATTADHSTTYAHQRNMRGPGEAWRRQGITLMPVVVESLGGWLEGVVRVVKRLAVALARHTVQEKDLLRHQPGLAISLQRGNAAILGNRIPIYPGLAIYGQY